MERPFDTILRQAYNSLEKTEKNFIFNFNQNDKILVWIVGFSITGITLIVSKITDLNKTYDNGVLKTALLLLIITVISGIVYRIFALLFLTKYQNKMFYLDGAFSKEKTMPTETSDLQDINDIHQIYQKIKSDFDFDYSDIIQLYNNAENTQSKNYYLEYLKSEYIRIGEWAKNEHEYGISYLKSVFKDTFGLSDKAIEEKFQANNDTAFLKIYSWICAISFWTCFICFLSVLILLASNYN
jgi:hypothetical protein